MHSGAGFASDIRWAVTWYGLSRLCRCSLSLSPIENQVSVTTQSALRTAASGSLPSRIGASVALIQSFIALFGASCGGVATFNLNLNRSAACAHDASTLLSSPLQAMVRLSNGAA